MKNKQNLLMILAEVVLHWVGLCVIFFTIVSCYYFFELSYQYIILILTIKFALSFLIVVFLHEFSHFLIAKYEGMRIYDFVVAPFHGPEVCTSFCVSEKQCFNISIAGPASILWVLLVAILMRPYDQEIPMILTLFGGTKNLINLFSFQGFDGGYIKNAIGRPLYMKAMILGFIMTIPVISFVLDFDSVTLIYHRSYDILKIIIYSIFGVLLLCIAKYINIYYTDEEDTNKYEDDNIVAMTIQELKAAMLQLIIVLSMNVLAIIYSIMYYWGQIKSQNKLGSFSLAFFECGIVSQIEYSNLIGRIFSLKSL